MTTDRELLELAAKAAEMNYVHELCGYYSDQEFNEVVHWNPITDDGDALRLAVKLGLSVCNSPRIGTSWVCNEHGRNIAEVVHDDAVSFNPYAATRRAIVRAAAEIGKGLQPFPTAKEIRGEWT